MSTPGRFVTVLAITAAFGVHRMPFAEAMRVGKAPQRPMARSPLKAFGAGLKKPADPTFFDQGVARRTKQELSELEGLLRTKPFKNRVLRKSALHLVSLALAPAMHVPIGTLSGGDLLEKANLRAGAMMKEGGDVASTGRLPAAERDLLQERAELALRGVQRMQGLDGAELERLREDVEEGAQRLLELQERENALDRFIGGIL